jgi:hypothetical protein
MGPMVMVQDASTAATLGVLESSLPPAPALCASACVSGAVGALSVGCQIEGLITRAHATGQTVGQTLFATRAAHGVAGLVLPYGALMIAAVRAHRSTAARRTQRARRARAGPPHARAL